MIRKATLLLMACFALLHVARAQYCGFDKAHQQMMQHDPTYAQKTQQFNSQLAAMLQSNSNNLIVTTGTGVAYQIPVVVHVINTGGAVGTIYNPTDAQLIGMVNYLNQTYAATWASYPSATTGGTYIPLQFVLAKRTPWCTPSNGINRVNGSALPGYVQYGIAHNGTNGAQDSAVKALSRWPNTEYYNVWVVNKIDSNDGTFGTFTAGYAYFAGASADIDGTIMLATQAQAGQITLPHEVGHAFSLYHTFEGDINGTTCPVNNNCNTDGDKVCDTDPHKRSQFNCPTGTNPCTGNAFGTVVHNFMDYSNCQDRFTAGQRTRIMNALVNYPGRSGLISSQASVPMLATPVTVACLPTVNNTTISGSNSGVHNVTISNASQIFMDISSDGYAGDSNRYYIDNSCKHLVDLTAGQIYNYSIKTGLQPEKVRVYVDYNNDGIFQSSELIYSHDGTQFNETHSFQYSVPTTATVPGLISCVPLRMRVISDRSVVSTVTACGQISYGQAEDYAIIIRGGGPTTGSVSIALNPGYGNPSCINSPLAFTATPAAGITATGYKWFVNGGYTGITAATYNSSTLANNDVITVKMFFVGACGNDSANSLPFTVSRAASVPAGVSIALTSGTNPGCPNQTLTFTATPVNGGAAPTYTWKVNNATVGTNSNAYSATFGNNDVVTVFLKSNSTCASPDTITASPITIQYLYNMQQITVALTNGKNPTCSGKPLTFTATVTNGGTNINYQWLVNSATIPGATNATFTSATLTNNAVVQVASTVTDPCVLNLSDTSTPITVYVIPSDTPNVQIAITKGSNPGCLDSLIEFKAMVTKHGAAPNLTWFVNGLNVAAGSIFSSNTLLNGDIVTLRSAATDTLCYTADTAFSAPLVMIRNSTPPAPVISFIGNMLVSNVTTKLQWFGPAGKIPGATSSTYHPTQAGSYYAVQDNNGCYSAPSNILTVSLLDIATYDLSQVKIYPNPTTGLVNLDWGTKNTTVRIDIFSAAGQGLYYDELHNGSHKILNLSNFASGNYFIVIRDEAGNIGTQKITLTK